MAQNEQPMCAENVTSEPDLAVGFKDPTAYFPFISYHIFPIPPSALYIHQDKLLFDPQKHCTPLSLAPMLLTRTPLAPSL
jgi:hypothetical protein